MLEPERSWTEVAAELSLQPTRTPEQRHRFQELTTELLYALCDTTKKAQGHVASGEEYEQRA